MRNLILGVAAAMTFGSAANAAVIANGSFETSTINPGAFTTLANGSTAINGWTVGGSSIDYIGTYWNAQNGSRSIDLAGSGIGSISQIFATVAGQAYNVSFFVSRNPEGGSTPRNGFVDVGGTQKLITYSNTASTVSNMLWQPETFGFTATGASTNLRFSADPATSATFFGLALDNVAVSAGPEPSTWAMMLFGFILVGGTMRSRKKRIAFA